jgi:hypothetical protein
MTFSRLTAGPAPAPPVTPRLLGFYQDVWDDDGTSVGWAPVAWGLLFGDGSVISIPVGRVVHVSLWHSLDDAVSALDADVDTPDPRRTISNDHRHVLPPLGPSSAPSAAVGDGPSALSTCPEPAACTDTDRPSSPNAHVRQAPHRGARP